MDQEPVFILAQNYNVFNSLKGWISNPPVFFVLFIWVMATIVSVKIRDTRPFKWVLVLTVFLLLFRVLPMSSHPIPMTQEQITQITTSLANTTIQQQTNAPVPKAVPVATPTITPKQTPSAQLIGN